MTEKTDFLDSVIARFRIWAKNAEAADKADACQFYEDIALKLEDVLDEYEELLVKTRPVPKTYGDLSDLPADLIAELAGVRTDVLESQIFSIVQSSGDEVDLDTILIELYRRFGVQEKRRFIQNKCYRMAQKELIFSVKGRKGVYAADPSEEAEDDEEDIVDEVDSIADLDDEIPF